MSKGKILIIDDEKNITKSISNILKREGYDTVLAYNFEDGRNSALHERIDLILLDILLPDGDGLDLLKELAESHRDYTVVMMSGHGTIETAVEATKLGAYDFLEKPISLDKLLITVENGLKLKSLESENIQLKEEVEKTRDDFIGVSPQMKDLMRKIETVAPTNGKVLITGENGTGKEMVARAVHEKSHRSQGPFIKVNCAAIPRELIESEMFGHEKGAFTGAIQAKQGKFELANGGTIFLDEIADMSLDTQAKVLRVLQEQEFERVGGTRTISVDVRVITATNADLLSRVEDGDFREDLYYRLNVIPFHIPPLRERREDIPLLVHYYFEKFAKQYGKPSREITPGAMELFSAHPWPGNVRELKNLIERIIIMIPDQKLEYDTLEELIVQSRIPSRKDSDGLDRIINAGGYRDSISQFEQLLIEKRLRSNSWNVSKTAKELGLERSHLYKKMKALGIEKPEIS
jgi:two-component system nitrogen regulation response regulator NtrX